MSDSTHPPKMTVVVRRRVRDGLEREFEAAMESFVRFALASPGHQGIWILRPARGAPPDYTIVDQFDSVAARREFTASPLYNEWMTKLGAFSAEAPRIEELPGMVGWFAPPDHQPVPRPPTWKMAVASFLGVYPLTASLPPLYQHLLPGWHPLLLNVVVTGTIVAALSWVVLPLLTRWLASWLFAPDSAPKPEPARR